jgi:hypothetical protein
MICARSRARSAVPFKRLKNVRRIFIVAMSVLILYSIWRIYELKKIEKQINELVDQ